MKRPFTTAIVLLLPTVFLAGCASEGDAPAQATASANGSKYLLTSAPADAQPVAEVRENAKDDEEVTITGRIGGDTDPWIEGKAAFLIVDSELKPCNEKHDDACETPWDYCCDMDVLPKSKLLVKIVDEQGRTVGEDARQLLGVKELQTVVAQGRVQRDEANNVVVLADRIFVQQ